MTSDPINLSSAAIGELTNIAVSASTGNYYQTGSLSKNGGTLQIYIPIDIYSAIGFPASCVNKITFNYEISQEKYGVFSSAGTVSTGYKNSGGSYTQVKKYDNGIGKGVDNFNSYSDEITGFYVSGNTVTLGMKITNVINKQTCYYRIRKVSFVIDYTPPSYTISTGVSPSGSGTVTGGGTYEHGSTATLKATAKTGYKFKYWQDNTSLTNATRTVTVTGNATYTAVFEKLTYTVTFKDDNGATLKTETVAYGDKPTPPTAPTKADTAQWKYTFDGWYDGNGNKWTSSTTITGATTFTARYTSTVQKYTIRWYNYDNTPLETDTDVPYGTKPTYNGATPTKPSDDYYTYGFAGWSPSTDEAIQGDKDFIAQFAQTDRYYTVRWVNASAEQGVEGALLETDEVKFDTQPDYNGETPKHPKQDSDPALNYDFIGWSAKVTDPAKPDTELEKVKGNITYTAIYETTPKLYAVTVILFDSQSTDVYEYGTEITIEAPEIVDFHRFVKWSDGDTRRSRPVTVTGEATYQAVYERIPIPIKANLEQVTGCYIVPTTKTIVYVISGTVPTVKIDMETVNGWSFLVSNSIPGNGYPLKKLFITDNGVTTRVY